jgi:hypothetical protein
MLKKNLFGIQLVLMLALSLPSLAQEEITSNQPVVGDLNAREVKLQAKLKDNFNAGLIDSDELAKFQRDFDGICVEEDDFKSRGNGMTDSARKSIMKRLDLFEADLDRHTGKSVATKKAGH